MGSRVKSDVLSEISDHPRFWVKSDEGTLGRYIMTSLTCTIFDNKHAVVK